MHQRMMFVVIGMLTLSFSAMSATITMVSAEVPHANDAPLVARLEALGFVVEVHDDNAGPHPVDVTNSVAVYIAESIGSGNITGAYKDVPIPVINSEPFTFDDLGYSVNDGFNRDPGEGDSLNPD